MRKLLAVIKREYLQRVRTKFFIVMTILGPLMLFVFTIVPALLIGFKAGGDTRLAVIDQTDDARVYESIRRSLTTRDREETDRQAVGPNAINANANERLKTAGRAVRGKFQVYLVQTAGRSSPRA